MWGRKRTFLVILAAFAASPALAVIPNDELTDRGFWSETFPADAANPPRVFRADDPALVQNSPGCSPVRARTRCERYIEVDVLISFSDELSNKEVRSFSKHHPWRRRPETRDRVVAIYAKSTDEITDGLRRVVGGCNVVRKAFFSSHGLPGVLSFERAKDDTYAVSTQDAFRLTGLACVLAPRATVQFDACWQVCREGTYNHGYAIERELNFEFNHPQYRTPANPDPFRGTRFLFNTAEGWVRPPFLNFLASGHWNVSITAKNDLAVVFTAGEGALRTDVPLESVPVCDPKGEKKK
jgi:hypothetical protein